MAIWQFDLHLIPRSKIIERYSRVPAQLSDEEFYTVNWWSGVALLIDYESILGSFLPKYISWHKDIFSWGAEDSDSIAIIFENNTHEEIFVRIDARKLDISFLEKVSHFAKLCDCLLLLVGNRKLMEPDPLALYQEIERSNAYKFVMNPRGFLDELTKQLREIMPQEFIATGIIGPIHLDQSKREVRSVLGDAQAMSDEQKGRELWKYDDLQLGFHQGVICFIGVYVKDDSIKLPPPLIFDEKVLSQIMRLEDMKKFLLAEELEFDVDNNLTFDDRTCLRNLWSNVGIYFDEKLWSIQEQSAHISEASRVALLARRPAPAAYGALDDSGERNRPRPRSG